jgi:hypothetical protein
MLYHIARDGQTYGPYTLEDLQKYVASGNVLPTDLAKSEDMAEPVPVSQLVGIAPPAIAPAPFYAAAPPYREAAALYPDPPNLHWALVLVIGIFTCGLFTFVWMIVQAAWMRRVDPRSKALFFYIGAIVLYIAGFIGQISLKAAELGGNISSAFVAGFSLLWMLAYLALFLTAIFSLRASIEEHFNGPEPIGLSLSGVMTFFFSLYYFQYHFTRINELKRLARYRGARI